MAVEEHLPVRAKTIDSTDSAAVLAAANEPSQARRVPSRHTGMARISAAWVAVCASSLGLVVLVIFMLQNTRGVQVSFLWLHGTVPLALALLTASVGTAVVVMVVGVARISQLRRQARRSV